MNHIIGRTKNLFLRFGNDRFTDTGLICQKLQISKDRPEVKLATVEAMGTASLVA